MAFDTKPNLSNDKFEQFSGETLTLKGTTEVHGRFEVESGGTFQLNDGTQQAGYVMTSNASGEGTWQTITPSAPVNSIQYNDNSEFSGSTGFTYQENTIWGVERDGGEISGKTVYFDGALSGVSYVFFNPTPPDITGATEGLLHYSSDEKALEFHTHIAESVIQIGQETVIIGVNKTGSLIPNGTPVAYAGTVQGNRPTIQPASGDTEENAFLTIGVATSDIADNEEAFITLIGVVRDINLSAYSNGDVLYLNTTGGTTNVSPSYPDSVVRLGVVRNNSASIGQLGVKVDYFYDPTAYVLVDTFTGYTASTLQATANGISDNGTTITLGGTLTGNTVIDATTSDLTIDAGTITGGTTLLRADIGASTDEPIIRFKNEIGNSVASGFVDINIGTCNLNASTEAWGNIAIGQSNLVGINATGDFGGGRNVAIGFSVGCDLTTGNNNVLLGRNVFQSSTTGAYNVIGGYGAGQNTTVAAKSNVALGLSAFNSVTTGTASYNVFLGNSAGGSPASLGNSNVGIGGSSFTTAGVVGAYNTGVGNSTFRNATLNTSNTAVGVSAGRFASGATDNTMVGRKAGWSLGGTSNSAFGSSAGCAPDATGSAGGTILTGSRNTFIGYQATWSTATPSINDSIVIGNDYEATESSKIYLASKGDIVLISTHDTASSGATTMTSSGLYYDADYSATGSTNPRWIPDNAYVTGLTSGGTSAAGDKIEKEITQASHGFALGDVIAYSGGTYIKALADGTQDAETLGVVSVSGSTSTFTLVYSGYIDSLSTLSL